MDRADILSKLLESLWTQYKSRVPYAATYQKMVEERGGRVINDHIAFRTFNVEMSGQPAGVEGIARIFLLLGYEQKENYVFSDKHLNAWHYEHATHPHAPKIFISQVEVAELKPSVADAIREAVKGAPDLLSSMDREQLGALGQDTVVKDETGLALVRGITRFFSRPWLPPKRQIIPALNQESQYAAWTLLHGNAVNHFTAYINEQNVKEWPDLETTVEALRAAGVPMKSVIEGEAKSKLRQSSTEASTTLCQVTEENSDIGKMDWSYAYYELAERGMVPGRDGKPTLFQAFLGAQATNLFEMTKRE